MGFRPPFGTNKINHIRRFNYLNHPPQSVTLAMISRGGEISGLGEHSRFLRRSTVGAKKAIARLYRRLRLMYRALRLHEISDWPSQNCRHSAVGIPVDGERSHKRDLT